MNDEFDPQFVESVEQMAATMNAQLGHMESNRTGAMPLVVAPDRVPKAYIDQLGQVWPHVATATIIVGITYLYTDAEVAAAVVKSNDAPPIVVVTSGARATQEALGMVKPQESAPIMKGDRARMLAVFDGKTPA